VIDARAATWPAAAIALNTLLTHTALHPKRWIFDGMNDGRAGRIQDRHSAIWGVDARVQNPKKSISSALFRRLYFGVLGVDRGLKMSHVSGDAMEVDTPSAAPITQHQQPQQHRSSSSNTDMVVGAMPNRKKLPLAQRKVVMASGGKNTADQKYLDLHSIIPESPLLHRLVATERHLDMTLRRRQVAMQEALPEQSNRKNTMTRLLRFCIYNTHEHQGKYYHADDQFESTLHEVPSWTLRIEGKLADDANTANAPSSHRKFTSFFKKMYVELDKSEFEASENWAVEWNRSGSVEDTDGFEIKRKSNKESTAHIFLHLDHTPERFQVSPALANLLGLQDWQNKTFTRTTVILQLWQYIRSKKLQQDPDNKANLTLDAPVRAVFGVDKTTYHDIPKLLSAHLFPPEPIQLTYQIKLSGEPGDCEQWFELPVEVDNPAYQIKLTTHSAEIEQLDQQIHSAIEKINDKKRKRDFYLDFATDPLTFLDDWLLSQIRDYKVWSSSLAFDPEFERSSEFFMQPLAADAFSNYLASRPRRIPAVEQETPISNNMLE
jgi:SWI/SNF-related matrix-associated actin-dependent regulator of chromatin subfamily D